MTTDDRTADMALLPAEREMSPDAWAEYGGLPPVLRSYCWRLMCQEGDARVHLREAELEVAEWRERSARLLSRVEAAKQRAEAAEAEVARLRAAIAETLRLADIYAGVASHNAEAEPETAGEAWRSPYMATMLELRRALGGAA